MSEDHRILIDRGTGRPILMSPVRVSRPRNTGPSRDGVTDCPFCAGNEARTPKEKDAVRGSTSADAAGWTARAFDNLYPAANCHEVIAEGRRHTVHPSELSHRDLADSLTLHRRRILAAEAHSEVALAFLFKNVGAAAGSSIEHNHSQLLGLESIPPRLLAELAACEEHGCLHCAEIETAAAEDRIIFANDSHVLLSPSTPKLPFEAWLLPRDHRDSFVAEDSATADGLVEALAATYRAVDESFDGRAFNTWLHRVPNRDFHWHFEIQPRIGQVAALELGADMYINAISAQASAARWRLDATSPR